MPVTAVSKKAGEKWKALSVAEKKPYDEAYKKVAEEYKQAIEEYTKNAGADDPEDEPEHLLRKRRAEREPRDCVSAERVLRRPAARVAEIAGGELRGRLGHGLALAEANGFGLEQG